jgi:formylglycine-generating enzyme required for sulfatase activity
LLLKLDVVINLHKDTKLNQYKLHNLFVVAIAALYVIAAPLLAHAQTSKENKAANTGKDRLVLMPLIAPVEDKNLVGAMETALVEGLQQKYEVFSGEVVAKKAREAYLKINQMTAVNTHCDEVRCMQNIAGAFQAELIAVANVAKQDGGYFLSLSIQNIFDNKVEYSKSIACAKCTSFQVVDKLKDLSGVIVSGAANSDVDETLKEADRKARAEQLKKEQQAFEEKLRNADATERKRLIDAKAADDKRLAELKAAAEARRKNTQAQPTTFPPLEQVQPEITKLNDKIATIEAGYDKELADTRKQVKQRYSDKLDALDKEQRDEFESKDVFNAKQVKKRNDFISQRDAELARLNVSKVAETETASLKARIKELTEHQYTVGVESIEAELGSYEIDDHQFTVKLRSKNSTLKLKLNSTISLQSAEAKTYKQQWQTGLIRPDAKAKFNGDFIDVSLVNDADNSRLVNFAGRFMTSIARDAEILATVGIMIPIPGKSFELGKYDVTQAQWRLMMGNNPSKFLSCGDTCPVERVNWNDVQDFIQKLNSKTGRQYRLPTEEEWEYACYGGNNTEYCGGSIPDNVAWYFNNSNETTHPVGKKLANGYGLFDMSGNVSQLMQNNFDTEHDWHVVRGGSWFDGKFSLLANKRVNNGDANQVPYIGFRLARTLPIITPQMVQPQQQVTRPVTQPAPQPAQTQQPEPLPAQLHQVKAPNRYVSQGGLTWMQVSFYKTWAEANAYCTNTAINGQTGWRLPTVNELSALYNSGAMKDQGWKLSFTWSSTLYGSGEHDGVNLGSGGVNSFGVVNGDVTCVREIGKTAELHTAELHKKPKADLRKGKFVSHGGLTWMPISIYKNWADANAYCTNANINSQSGWRLPTKNELSDLYASGSMSGKEWTLDNAWSSTPDRAGFHFYVNLLKGFDHPYDDTSYVYVTCVRGKSSVEAKVIQQTELLKRYVSLGGLTWMPITFTKSWTDANAYCTKTVINGQAGWRLPTKNELKSLYLSGAMIGQGWTLNNTWSSTLDSSGYHFYVYLDNGKVFPTFNSDSSYVTCVR